MPELAPVMMATFWLSALMHAKNQIDYAAVKWRKKLTFIKTRFQSVEFSFSALFTDLGNFDFVFSNRLLPVERDGTHNIDGRLAILSVRNVGFCGLPPAIKLSEQVSAFEPVAFAERQTDGDKCGIR